MWCCVSVCSSLPWNNLQNQRAIKIPRENLLQPLHCQTHKSHHGAGGWSDISLWIIQHCVVTRPFSINNMSETTLWEPHPETWLWVTVDPHCQIRQWPSSSSTMETALTISGLADVKQGRIWSARTKETQQGGWFIYEWTEQKRTWLKKKVGSSTWYAFPQLNYHSLLEIIHRIC